MSRIASIQVKGPPSAGQVGLQRDLDELRDELEDYINNPNTSLPAETAARIAGDNFLQGQVDALALAIAAQGGVVQNIPSIAAIMTTIVAANINVIRTEGFRTKGKGAAYYVSQATLPTSGKGVLWQQTANGRYFVLARDQAITPSMFGSWNTGASHAAVLDFVDLPALQMAYPFAISLMQEMDYLACQSAVNFQGPFSSEKTIFWMMNNAGDPQKPLICISGLTAPRFAYSTLNFSALTPNLNPTWRSANQNFATAAGWQNATIYTPLQLIDATFNTGAAVMIDIGWTTGSTPNTFYQWGRLVTLQPGDYEVTGTVTATLGASKARGNFNPPQANLQFFDTGPGQGGNLSGSSVFANFDVLTGTDVQVMRYTFSLAAAATGWLTFTGYGYANYTVSEFGVRDLVNNCAVLLTRDGATEPYPPAIAFSEARLVGPGRTAIGARGFWSNSLVNIDGACMNIADCDVRGFDSGWEGGNGAYLIEFLNNKMISNNRGYYFPAGNKNAGENLRIVGGENNSNGILIESYGAEWTIVQTSKDYADRIGFNNGQIIVGRGQFTFDMVHMETRPTTTIGKPLYDLESGTIITLGGYQLLSSPLGGCVEPPIHLQTSHATWRNHDTVFYNMTDANGIMQDGAGQILGRINNISGNPNIGILVSKTPAMDILNGAGLFGDEIGFGDTGKKAVGSGTFTTNGGNNDTITIGTRTYTIKTVLTGIADEILSDVSGAATGANLASAIVGGAGAGVKYGTGTVPHADVTASAGGGIVRLTARLTGIRGNAIALSEVSAVFSWATATLTGGIENINIEGGVYPYADAVADTQWSGNNYSLTREDTVTYDGSKNLKYRKTVAGNTRGGSIRLLVPLNEYANVMGHIYFMFNANVGVGTAPLYFRTFYVTVVGQDALLRPRLASKVLFKSEVDLVVPLDGTGVNVPIRRIVSTVYSEKTSDMTQGRTTMAPVWATHYAIIIDTQDLPIMDFDILNLRANPI